MRYHLLLPLLLVSATLLFAQSRQEKETKKLQMQQERIEFFTRELTLGKEESIALGEILREFDKKKIALRHEIHTSSAELLEKKKPSNDDLVAYIKLRYENDVRIAKLEEEKLLKLSEVLPPEKVLRIEETKRKFFDHFVSKRSR